MKLTDINRITTLTQEAMKHWVERLSYCMPVSPFEFLVIPETLDWDIIPTKIPKNHTHTQFNFLIQASFNGKDGRIYRSDICITVEDGICTGYWKLVIDKNNKPVAMADIPQNLLQEEPLATSAA